MQEEGRAKRMSEVVILDGQLPVSGSARKMGRVRGEERERERSSREQEEEKDKIEVVPSIIVRVERLYAVR